MDVKDLNYFLEVARYENVSRAASVLHITQPPLSRAIKQLETELGVDLFIREHGRLKLTDAGRFLQQKSEEILELIDITKSQIFEEYKGSIGKIRIGTIETVSAGKLPKWIADFHKIYPDITYQIMNNNTDEIIRLINSGILDIGIVRDPINGENFEKIRLKEDNWVACIPDTNPLANQVRSYIDLVEIKDESLILPSRGLHEKQIKNWFELIGSEPQIVCWYSSLVSGTSLVKNGVGIMLCPQSVQYILDTSHIAVREIVNPALTTGSIIIWKNSQSLSTAARKFTDFIRNQL